MQGDIYQLEQMAAKAKATQSKPRPVQDNSTITSEVAIYNEDDLSHLLYANHMHHDGHKDRVIVNHVYRDGYCTPLESPMTGTQTPLSETNETPILSDCESDVDEGAYLPSPPNTYSRRNPLRFEDGFDFPVFLGRQMEESSPRTMDTSSEFISGLDNQSKHVRIAAPEEHHVPEISGPLMSWWPEPIEFMEHEWVEEKSVANKNARVLPTNEHVSDIGGPLMSWWPAPVEMLEHEWDDKFYE
ncbi:uncharacterized protein GGS25DRAFT_503054 [Hypoxylon fragiforme]|uniref:uncharacterized protein n=1 Tax=Hypoxylon fragiforme TaxID=63214 RepID=UPI0020C72D21|nr:uncharacterized protein GGS25DRAFT_503054 [Hypoxylon fragiforme]KAI2605004.1 hypothetical protein GGS25DRAFT_503054 [Hypoxylon fragiforme]